MSHLPKSKFVSLLLGGSVLAAYSSVPAMAVSITREMGLDEDDILAHWFLHDEFTHPFTEWLVRAELAVAIRIGSSIQELRDAVPLEQLERHYVAYHVFFTIDDIFHDIYAPALGIEIEEGGEQL